MVVLHQVAHAGHQVVHGDGRDPQALHLVGAAGLDLAEADDGIVRVGDHREVRPQFVVEEMAAQGVQGLGQGVDMHGHVGVPEDVLGEERQGADVVQVRVADEDLPDPHLLLEGKGLGEASRVDGDGAVHQEPRQAVAFGLAPRTP